MNIPICKETVAMAKECLLSGKSFKPFDQLFIPSESVTAKHELYNEFVNKTGCLIPKIFIYIVMDDLFGVAQEKDEKGNFGYKLSFKQD
jgi:hypothetical protein